MKRKILAAVLTIQVVLLLFFFVDFNKRNTDDKKSVVGAMRENETLL